MSSLMICPNSQDCKNKHKRGSDATKNHPRCIPHPFYHLCNAAVDYQGMSSQTTTCPPCIPYIPEFKVGDRVRVLGKTEKRCGKMPNYDTLQTLESTGVKVGDVRSIEKFEGNCQHCNQPRYTLIQGGGGYFHPQDLELIITEDDMDKPKYKVAKNVTLSIGTLYLANKNECGEFFKQLTALMDDLRPATVGDPFIAADFIAWAEKDPKRIKWLIEKGYIEEVQLEVFYRHGDMFRHTEKKEKAMLVTVGGSAAHLVLTEGKNIGKSWVGIDIEIKDAEKITEKELDAIAGLRGAKGWEQT